MAEYPSGEFLLPLFPLPNLVFFPKTRLPLHVFEPRYRQMISDAMITDQRIGIVLLRPGWQSDYFGNPPIHEYGTLGVIEHIVTLEDGRYNLLVRGDVRFRVLEQLSEVPYRVARVVVDLETGGTPEESYAAREWLAELSRRYLELLPNQMDVPELDSASVDSLTNALTMSLNLEIEEKQELLEMTALKERCDRIGELLEARLETMQFLAPFRRVSDPSTN